VDSGDKTTKHDEQHFKGLIPQKLIFNTISKGLVHMIVFPCEDDILKEKMLCAADAHC